MEDFVALTRWLINVLQWGMVGMVVLLAAIAVAFPVCMIIEKPWRRTSDSSQQENNR